MCTNVSEKGAVEPLAFQVNPPISTVFFFGDQNRITSSKSSSSSVLVHRGHQSQANPRCCLLKAIPVVPFQMFNEGNNFFHLY